MEYSAASLDGFLNLEGCADIQLGIDLAANDFGGKPPYQKRLASHAIRYKCNYEAESAVRLYRKILAKAKEPIEMLEIGYLQAFTQLLESPADDISTETGLELVKKKVKKCWVMAGKWIPTVKRKIISAETVALELPQSSSVKNVPSRSFSWAGRSDMMLLPGRHLTTAIISVRR